MSRTHEVQHVLVTTEYVLVPLSVLLTKVRTDLCQPLFNFSETADLV